MIRKARQRIVHLGFRVLSLFEPGFSNQQFPLGLQLRHVLIQKILRINSHVPWPVHTTTKVISPERIERGTRCPGLGMSTYIDGRNGIIIGKNTWIGPRVSLISMNHDLGDYEQYQDSEPIILGDNCWLGANSVILPSVRLGNHVVVAAGSVVTKSFPGDDILLAGVPARIIKQLEPYQGSMDHA